MRRKTQVDACVVALQTQLAFASRECTATCTSRTAPPRSGRFERARRTSWSPRTSRRGGWTCPRCARWFRCTRRGISNRTCTESSRTGRAGNKDGRAFTLVARSDGNARFLSDLVLNMQRAGQRVPPQLHAIARGGGGGATAGVGKGWARERTRGGGRGNRIRRRRGTRGDGRADPKVRRREGGEAAAAAGNLPPPPPPPTTTTSTTTTTNRAALAPRGLSRRRTARRFPRAPRWSCPQAGWSVPPPTARRRRCSPRRRRRRRMTRRSRGASSRRRGADQRAFRRGRPAPSASSSAAPCSAVSDARGGARRGRALASAGSRSLAAYALRRRRGRRAKVQRGPAAGERHDDAGGPRAPR